MSGRAANARNSVSRCLRYTKEEEEEEKEEEGEGEEKEKEKEKDEEEEEEEEKKEGGSLWKTRSGARIN